MAMNLLNTSSIAKEMQTKVTERMGDWFEAEFKAKANTASRRTRLIRSHGHTSVSYTHLTLPTSDLVELSEVAVTLKKKKKNETTN